MHDRARQAAEIPAARDDCRVVHSANVGYAPGINRDAGEAILGGRPAASAPNCSGRILRQ
jgi:hypothetical protein